MVSAISASVGIGVKVWIYKGEVLSQTLRTTPRTMDTTKPLRERGDRPRRDRRDGDRRDRRDGDRRGGGRFGDRDRKPGPVYQARPQVSMPKPAPAPVEEAPEAPVEAPVEGGQE